MTKQIIRNEIENSVFDIESYRGIISLLTHGCNPKDRELDVIFEQVSTEKLRFSISVNEITRIYDWLMEILTNPNVPNKFLLRVKEQYRSDCYIGYEPLCLHPDINLHKEPYQNCMFYIYSLKKHTILRKTFGNAETTVLYMYSSITNSKGLRNRSAEINDYYKSKVLPPFSDNGYRGFVKAIPQKNYYSLEMLSPDGKIIPNINVRKWNLLSLYNTFRDEVCDLLYAEGWKKSNEQWKEKVDFQSVDCVFNIKPDEFLHRVKEGLYDKTLNVSVKGGNYEVPLYYVTKAWDILLNQAFDDIYYLVESDEDDPEERTFESARSQNNEMKRIWYEVFGIDIDSLAVDFRQFDMHSPEYIGEENSSEYFYGGRRLGLEEWIMNGINDPKNPVNFESVSGLMEFTFNLLFCNVEEIINEDYDDDYDCN